jgi:hypothetical protein
MFRATNALAFKGVHLLGSQSVDYRLIVHGLIVTFTLGKAAQKALKLSQEALPWRRILTGPTFPASSARSVIRHSS